MNTLVKSVAVIVLVLCGASAFAATGVDLYWPLRDGDQATFKYDRNKTLTLTVTDLGGGQFEIYEDCPDVSASLYVQVTMNGIVLSGVTVGWTDVSFDPSPALLNDTIAQNGGTLKTSTTVSQSRLDPYPATFTLKVRKVKRVKVPAGKFSDCRSIVSSEKARIPGHGTVRASALTAYLAPNVGIVKMLVKRGHWATLVSTTSGAQSSTPASPADP